MLSVHTFEITQRVWVRPARLLPARKLARRSCCDAVRNPTVLAPTRMAPRPGLVEVALSWDAIRRAIAENTVESLGRLGRFEENILVYRRFRAQVVEEWASMTDFMHNRIFGWEPRLDEAGKKFVPLPTPPFQAKQIVWRENDFPYSCEAGIEHHNVWCTQALTPDEVAKVVAQHRQGYEWQVFVNPPTLQSIPTVWHCHVFSRPRTESLQ